jgi:hypothetical protein
MWNNQVQKVVVNMENRKLLQLGATPRLWRLHLRCEPVTYLLPCQKELVWRWYGFGMGQVGTR